MLREKIHHLDDMLKSQQRKVRQMIEQVRGAGLAGSTRGGRGGRKPPRSAAAGGGGSQIRGAGAPRTAATRLQPLPPSPRQLQNSKAVIQAKDAATQELKERVAYLEAEVRLRGVRPQPGAAPRRLAARRGGRALRPREPPRAQPGPRRLLQNLEMHDRIEHLIEKQVSRGGHSARARSKSEYVSR